MKIRWQKLIYGWSVIESEERMSAKRLADREKMYALGSAAEAQRTDAKIEVLKDI